jgi:hypothetical protein
MNRVSIADLFVLYRQVVGGTEVGRSATQL